MPKYQQGFFTPTNPIKYKGNVNHIIYRSSWELSLMLKFDKHPNVLEWSSERVIVPYTSPLDGRTHRYYPDFLVKLLQTDNTIKTVMIEVKPEKEMSPPKTPKNTKKPSKSFLYQATTYAVNQAKWKAAQSYCDAQGWKFQLMPERDINRVR